jgi:hypothetical protein
LQTAVYFSPFTLHFSPFAALRLSKPLSILGGHGECVDHLGVDEITLEAAQLIHPEVISLKIPFPCYSTTPADLAEEALISCL